MDDLTQDELERCIVEGGGAAKWAKAVRRLLGMPPAQPSVPVPAGVPPSAFLLTRVAPIKMKQPHEALFPDSVLGEDLTRAGTLHLLKLPVDRLMAAVKDTKDPARQVLSYLDSAAVVKVTWIHVISEHGNLNGDKTLFTHLTKQLLKTEGGIWWGKDGKKMDAKPK